MKSITKSNYSKFHAIFTLNVFDANLRLVTPHVNHKKYKKTYILAINFHAIIPRWD